MRRLLRAALLCVGLSPLVAEPKAFVPLLEGQVQSTWSPELRDPRWASWTGWEGSMGAFSYRGAGGLASSEGQVRSSLVDAWVAVQGDAWQLKAGWWPDQRGPGVFRSLFPTWSASASTEDLPTAGNPVPRSAAKILARWSGDEGSVTVEVAPRPPEPELPDADSWWLPRNQIPQGFLYLGTWTPLGTLTFSRGTQAPETPAWRVTAVWDASWATWSGAVYQGPDNVVLFPARFEPASTAHRVDLQAQVARVSQGWLSVQVPSDVGTFWAETAYTVGRWRELTTWEQDPVGPTFIQHPLTTETVWEGLAGASSPPLVTDLGALRGWSEVQKGVVIGSPETTLPAFQEGWVAGFRWDWPREQGAFNLTLGGPWSPNQGWLWAKIEVPGVAGQVLWWGVPWFWGPENSDWGQFRDRCSVGAGAKWTL